MDVNVVVIVDLIDAVDVAALVILIDAVDVIHAVDTNHGGTGWRAARAREDGSQAGEKTGSHGDCSEILPAFPPACDHSRREDVTY